MAIVGSIEFTVKSLIPPQFAAQVQRQVAAATKGLTFPVPQIDTREADKFKKTASGLFVPTNIATDFQAKVQEPIRKATRDIGEKTAEGAGRARTAIQGLQGQLESLGLSTRNLAVLMGAGLTGSAFIAGVRIFGNLMRQVGQAIGATIRAARDLNEQISASEVVFEGAAGRIQDFASRSAQSLGISRRAALEASVQFGILFQNIDVGQAEELSEALVSLSADLASFANIPVDEALTRLRSGLLGETEAVRKLGIVLGEATIQSEAMRLGLIRQGEQMSENEKRAVRLFVVFDQTQKQQGDFARTSGQLANAQRILSANIEDLNAIIGQAFVPIAEDATAAMNALVVGIKDFAEATLGGEEGGERMAAVLKTIVAQIPGLGPTLVFAFERLAERGRRIQEEAAKAAERDVARTKELAREIARVEGEIRREQQRAAEVLELPERIVRQRLDLRSAELGVRQAVLGVRDAQESLNRLRREAERDVLRLASAELSLERAQLGVIEAAAGLERAQREVIEAEKDLAKIRDPARRERRLIDVTLDLDEAHLRLRNTLKEETDSWLELARARLGIIDAEEALERAQRRGNAGRRQELEATLSLFEARAKLEKSQEDEEARRISIARAQLGLADAEEEFRRVSSGQEFAEAETAALERLSAVQLQLESAHLTVRSAAIALKTAEFEVADAHQTVRDRALELEKAELSVASAQLAVERSAFDAATAARDLEVSQRILGGETLTTSDRQRILAERLGNVAATMIPGGPLRSSLEGYSSEMAALAARAEAVNREMLDHVSLLEAQAGQLETIKELNADIIDQLPALATIGVGGGGAAGGGQVTFQHGGILPAGQTGLVGERGPELIRVGSTSRVFSNADTNAILGQILASLGELRGVGTINVNEVGGSASATARAIERILGRRAIR